MKKDGDTKRQPESEGLLFADLVNGISRRLVVFSGKGGVGKTTVAVNLSYALADVGLRVGLLDADISGPNVLQMTGVTEAARGIGAQILPHEKDGVRIVSLASMLPQGAPVIWRGPMRSKVIEQFLTDTAWGDVDTLVVDLPPGTGDEVLTISQRIAPQVALIITTPQEVARMDARRAVNFARKLSIPHIGIVENMSGFFCPHCGEAIALFGSGASLQDAKDLGVEHFGTLPMDADAPREGDAGTPSVRTRPTSPLSYAIQGIVTRLTPLLDHLSQ